MFFGVIHWRSSIQWFYSSTCIACRPPRWESPFGQRVADCCSWIRIALTGLVAHRHWLNALATRSFGKLCSSRATSSSIAFPQRQASQVFAGQSGGHPPRLEPVHRSLLCLSVRLPRKPVDTKCVCQPHWLYARATCSFGKVSSSGAIPSSIAALGRRISQACADPSRGHPPRSAPAYDSLLCQSVRLPCNAVDMNSLCQLHWLNALATRLYGCILTRNRCT